MSLIPPYLFDLNTLCEHYTPQLQTLFHDRPIILLRNILAGSTLNHLKTLRELGAQPALILYGRRGTGPIPDPNNAEHHTHSIIHLGLSSTPNIMDTFRSFDAALHNLTPDVLAAVEHYDPQRRALALVDPPLLVEHIAQRPRLGARPASWLALEDKVVIDAYWKRWNIPHAPHTILPADALQPLWDAHRALDQGMGTVWNADASEGWHGGAVFLRWVRTREDAERAFNELGPISKTMRVMPFLDGTPCSIHGFVLPSKTIALRPVEMVVLRNPETRNFLYAGLNTWWDPPERDRDAMRSVAQTVGEGLRRDVSYRGAFTVDGVLTRDGFIPTELNPRYGAALYVMGHAAEPLPLAFLDMAIKHGVAIDHLPDLLETTLLDLLDDKRAGGAWCVVPSSQPSPDARLHVVQTEHGWSTTDNIEERAGTLIIGEAPAGCFIRYAPNPKRHTKGTSIAPYIASLLQFVSQKFNITIEHYQAAPSLRV